MTMTTSGFGSVVGTIASETFRFGTIGQHCHVSANLAELVLLMFVWIVKVMLGTALLIIVCVVWLVIGLIRYTCSLRSRVRAQ